MPRRHAALLVAALAAVAIAPPPAVARFEHDAAAGKRKRILVPVAMPAEGDLTYVHVVVGARGVKKGRSAPLPRITLPSEAALERTGEAIAVLAGIARQPRSKTRFQVDIVVLHARPDAGDSLAGRGSAALKVYIDDPRDDTIDYSGRSVFSLPDVASTAETGEPPPETPPSLDDTVPYSSRSAVDHDLPIVSPIGDVLKAIGDVLRAFRDFVGGFGISNPKSQDVFADTVGLVDHFDVDVPVFVHRVAVSTGAPVDRIRWAGSPAEAMSVRAALLAEEELTTAAVTGTPEGGQLVWDGLRAHASWSGRTLFFPGLDHPLTLGASGTVTVGRGPVEARHQAAVEERPLDSLLGCTITTAIFNGREHVKIFCPIPFDAVRLDVQVPVGPHPFGVFDASGAPVDFGQCLDQAATELFCRYRHVEPDQHMLIDVPQGLAGPVGAKVSSEQLGPGAAADLVVGF
jgi:hypothetical protein